MVPPLSRARAAHDHAAETAVVLAISHRERLLFAAHAPTSSLLVLYPSFHVPHKVRRLYTRKKTDQKNRLKNQPWDEVTAIDDAEWMREIMQQDDVCWIGGGIVDQSEQPPWDLPTPPRPLPRRQHAHPRGEWQQMVAYHLHKGATVPV